MDGDETQIATRPSDVGGQVALPAYQDPRRRNRNLQWLRAFAALSVVLYHSSVYLERFTGDARLLQVFDGRFGLIGVAVFFAISGYLMAEILPRTDPWTFLVHRVTRIYPIFLIVLGSLIVARGKFGEFDLWAMTLVPVGDGRIYYLGVEWTLLFETSFYVFLFACSLIGLKNRLEWVAVIWLAVLVVGTVVSPAQQLVLTPTIDLLPLLSVNAAFAGGLLIPALLRRNVFQPASAALAVGLVLLFGASGFGFDRWAASLAAVVLVGLAARNDHQPAGRANALTRLADRYGDWSYALYLCHAPLIIGMMIGRPPIPPLLLWTLGIAIPLIIAIPYGILDLFLYRRLKRTVDGWSIPMRGAVSIAYVAAFALIASYAAIWGTMRGETQAPPQTVVTPIIPDTTEAAPTLMPADPSP